MKLLLMRVGQVLIYDHRLLHCSDINSTSDHRPGAVMGLVPAETELMHYVVDGEQIRQRQDAPGPRRFEPGSMAGP